MTDVATTDSAPAMTGGGANTAQDETYIELILHHMALLENSLGRVADLTVTLTAVAAAADEVITNVDEESTRVEAPAATRAATDAANVVGKMITRVVADVSRHAGTTRVLVLTARRGMRPAKNVQDDMRAIGAGPKLLASAGK